MPNLATALKDEIQRLARKEVKAQTSVMKKASTQHRRDIAELKRRVRDLAKELAYLRKQEQRRAGRPAAQGATASVRFSPPWVNAHRKKLEELKAAHAAARGDLIARQTEEFATLEGGFAAKRKALEERIAAADELIKMQETLIAKNAACKARLRFANVYTEHVTARSLQKLHRHLSEQPKANDDHTVTEAHVSHSNGFEGDSTNGDERRFIKRYTVWYFSHQIYRHRGNLYVPCIARPGAGNPVSRPEFRDVGTNCYDSARRRISQRDRRIEPAHYLTPRFGYAFGTKLFDDLFDEVGPRSRLADQGFPG